ncbi:MAG: hypothetical protein IKC97_01550 [Clostridia bacterium]|nr:hypothetical protein [Clostridia bacterium]
MKPKKRNRQGESPRDMSPLSPAPHYSTFMSDPRLAMLAKPKESPKKRPHHKIAAKITTIVGALLALAMLAAVFVPMLREHFASLPEDPPIDPPVDHPVDPPVDPPIDPPDVQPVDPPDQPVDPPVEPEWEKAKLSFDCQHFKKNYIARYKADLVIKYDRYTTFVGLSGLLDRWSDVMLQSFQHNGKFVTFRTSSMSWVRQLAKIFIFDALCELRTRKGVVDTVSEQECLDIVAYAADQISNFTYIRGGGAKIGDECSYILAEVDRVSLSETYEKSLRLQTVHTAKQYYSGTIDTAIDTYSISVARAMVLLLFGYTHPVYDTATSELERQYRKTYFAYLNQSLDEKQMQAYTEQIAEIVREQFDEYPTYTAVHQQDMINCLDFVPFKMWQAVIDALPTMVEQTTGMSYSEFLTGGHMSSAWYIDLESRYNPYGNYTVQSVARHVYRDRLNALLAQLTFEPGDIRLTKQCEISYTEPIFPAFGDEQRLYLATNYTAISPELLPFPIFSAGYTETGDYYLQSSHYFAPLTEEQYKEFVAICSPDTFASDIPDIRATIWAHIIGRAQS